MIAIPEIYRDGYERARAVDTTLARLYIEHTVLDDPPADAAIAAVARCDQAELGRYTVAAMDRNEAVVANAPREFREFFERIETPPQWYDVRLAHAGRHAFNKYSDAFIQAFFVVTVRNATSLISKAFYATGRVLSQHAHRRIRQNTRHLIEIMLPHSLERDSDGWKLSVRVRLVHAQVRHLIRAGGEWDEAVYGVPLSAAHMGLASANFSATLVREAMRLGARLDDEARRSIMHIWRYASWLCGTPESLLFEGDEHRTAGFLKIASLCEPPPGRESIEIAKHLVEALPEIAGKTKPRARRAMERHVFRVARALVGPEVADQLGFPRYMTWGLLPMLRVIRRFVGVLEALSPKLIRRLRLQYFVFLLEASMLLDMSYLLPDKLRARDAKPW